MTTSEIQPSVSVVVPVFNGAPTLVDLAERLDRVLGEVASRHQIIFVDDASRDESWGVIETLAGKYPAVEGIALMRNYGQHNALLCGIRRARYEVIVTVDDDLQNPPEEIPKLLVKLDEGFDAVYGKPAQEQHGFLRDVASRLTKSVLQGAMGAETAKHVSAFRAFRSQLRGAMEAYSGPFVSIDVLLTWGTTRFAAIAVEHQPRRQGESNYTLGRLIVHALNMMTGFSVLPLQLASMVGVAFTVFGLLILVFVVGRYLLHGGSVPGFPFLASIIAIFSGAQMFTLGIFGEYLARMHFRVMDKPAYTVRGTTTKDA